MLLPILCEAANSSGCSCAIIIIRLFLFSGIIWLNVFVALLSLLLPFKTPHVKGVLVIPCKH